MKKENLYRKKFMSNKTILTTWRDLLANPSYLFSLFEAGVLWLAGYFVYLHTISYVDRIQSTSGVGDLLLDILPVVDLRFFYLWGIIAILSVFFGTLFFKRPGLLPFALKVFLLVFVTRAIFITLTHLGPPAGFLIPTFVGDGAFWPLSTMMHANDLFFSGHVAYPFMAVLIFSKSRLLRWFFLIASVVMAVTVLLMRIHYSIDVFASFFIVFGMYHLAIYWFGKRDLNFET